MTWTSDLEMEQRKPTFLTNYKEVFSIEEFTKLNCFFDHLTLSVHHLPSFSLLILGLYLHSCSSFHVLALLTIVLSQRANKNDPFSNALLEAFQ